MSGPEISPQLNIQADFPSVAGSQGQAVQHIKVVRMLKFIQKVHQARIVSFDGGDNVYLHQSPSIGGDSWRLVQLKVECQEKDIQPQYDNEAPAHDHFAMLNHFTHLRSPNIGPGAPTSRGRFDLAGSCWIHSGAQYAKTQATSPRFSEISTSLHPSRRPQRTAAAQCRPPAWVRCSRRGPLRGGYFPGP